MGLRNADHFRRAYLAPAIAAKLLEMTAPESPRSTKQRYRLTAKGRQWLKAHHLRKAE
jgi:ATP-dependent DNA helicase RecG